MRWRRGVAMSIDEHGNTTRHDDVVLRPRGRRRRDHDRLGRGMTFAELFGDDVRHCQRCGLGIDDLHPDETLCIRCWAVEL